MVMMKWDGGIILPTGNKKISFEQREYPNGNLYAIGDIHGCLNALIALIEKLHREHNFNMADEIVFLGDYIDRGKSSSGVLQYLSEFKVQYPRTQFLRGNHEDMFLDFFLKQGMYGESYLGNGGKKVMKEYKIDRYVGSSGGGYTRIPKLEVYKMIPQTHTQLIESTKFALEYPDILFVHGGMNIYKTKEEQTAEDVVWMREPFLYSQHEFGKWVVHGHTPVDQVYFNTPYEINMDTGCVFGKVYGNKLSAIKFKLGDIINSEIIAVENPDSGCNG